MIVMIVTIVTIVLVVTSYKMQQDILMHNIFNGIQNGIIAKAVIMISCFVGYVKRLKLQECQFAKWKASNIWYLINTCNCLML